MRKNYYEILQVSPQATQPEIKSAYKRLAMMYHPDRCKLPNAHELFLEINEAYQVLGDSSKRSQYDNWGKYYQEQIDAYEVWMQDIRKKAQEKAQNFITEEEHLEMQSYWGMIMLGAIGAFCTLIYWSYRPYQWLVSLIALGFCAAFVWMGIWSKKTYQANIVFTGLVLVLYIISVIIYKSWLPCLIATGALAITLLANKFWLKKLYGEQAYQGWLMIVIVIILLTLSLETLVFQQILNLSAVFLLQILVETTYKRYKYAQK